MTQSNYIAKQPDVHGWVDYTDAENAVWKTLYERQTKLIEQRACPEYLKGINTLGLNADRIPQCDEVSGILHALTGWRVEPVAALISFKEFFSLLNQKKFPAATFIRTADEIDYLKEPDIFHELFGHCPMLTNQAFADFTHEVGKLGVSIDSKDHAMLARLYWFTVEFGLIHAADGLRVYGGGILSSKTETVYALESDIPTRNPFDLLTVLRTKYRYDMLQKNYFVIESFDALFNLIKADLVDTFDTARQLGPLPSDDEEPNETRSC